MTTPSAPPLDPDSRAHELFRRVGGVADVSLRVEYLRSQLVAASPAEVAGILQATAEAADAGVRGYPEMTLHLAVALAPTRLEGIRRAAAAAAIAHGQLLARALLVPETRRGTELPDEPRRPVVTVPGRTVTLGERKSLARGRSRFVLDRILHDPDEEVVRILLGNPAVREADVLRLASRRPIPAEILRVVFVHPRWFPRYAVRFALVQNPHLPTDLGLSLVRSLLRQDAETLVAATELAETVREAALLLTQRPELH